MDEKQEKRFWKFIKSDDMDFYEEYTIHLTNEEQEVIFDENPNFLCDYPVSCDKIYLLHAPIYRKLLRSIKRFMKEK